MASEFDVYSFVKGQFGVEIVGQGKNGTYDTVHLYIQPFSKNDDRLAIDEYVGRYAETPSWSKIFTLSENDLSDAIKIYNNYVISSDRIDIHMIDKEIYKKVKMRLDDVLVLLESSRKSSRKLIKESITESKTNYLTVEEFCNLCAKIYIHCKIWSFDGHNQYEEFYNLSRVKSSPYKNYDVLMWDFNDDVLILYIENNAIPL